MAKNNFSKFVSLSKETIKKVERECKKQKRSFSAQVSFILEEYFFKEKVNGNEKEK
jgi:hypothetical protein